MAETQSQTALTQNAPCVHGLKFTILCHKLCFVKKETLLLWTARANNANHYAQQYSDAQCNVFTKEQFTHCSHYFAPQYKED